MSSILDRLGYKPKTEAGQEMLGETGEFFERLETEYKLPPPIGGAPSAAPLLGVRGLAAQAADAGGQARRAVEAMRWPHRHWAKLP
jgi:hypothetical protein